MELFGEGFGGMAVLAEVSLGTSEVWLFPLLSTCGSDVSSQLLLPHHACLPAAMIPAMMAMDSHSETMRPHKYFFYKFLWSRCFVVTTERLLRQPLGWMRRDLKIYPMWTVTKRQRKCLYQPDQTDFQSKSQGHHVIIKKAVHWSDIAIVNKCVPNTSALDIQSKRWHIWRECTQ